MKRKLNGKGKKKNLDIVFINPPLSQEERYGVKFKAGGQTPPTGLAYLAAVCRQKGYSVEIIDAPALDMSSQQVLDKILELKPKYIGITAVTISIFNAIDVAKFLREKYPRGKIILGGAHITAAPLETVERFGIFFDVAVLGEGELTIIDLLKTLDKKKSLSEVKGIAYPDETGKTLRFTPSREFIEDLDSLPFPAYDLLPDLAEHYSPPAHTVKRFPAALLITSRGCPGMCTFCDNKVFGRVLRCHSADYVLKLILHLKKTYGIKEIQFRDDNFLVFRKRTKELCELLIKKKVNIVWSCAGRVDMINPEMLQLMKKAGCWQIWYGVESGSDKVLAAIKKNTNQEKISRAIIDTKKAGISPGGFFMIGMPTETEQDIKKTIDVLLKLPLDEFHITHLTPFPGSEIYASASQYGYFDNDWKKLSGWKTVFVPKGLSKKKLIHYSNYAFKKFYFRPRIILNYLKRIRSWRHLKVYFTAFIGFVVYISKKIRN
ncbi:MAG: B12-binding domain-containing radical SAM protein [Candidatus Woesearchaeota archaeon]